MLRWGDSLESSGSNWHITWLSSNLSSKNRVVIRIYAGEGTYASALWVYSSASTTYHPYKTGFGNGKAITYIGGRMDDRDVGPIIVSGIFHN